MDMRDSTMSPSNVTIRANASLNAFFSLTGDGTNYFTDGRTRLVYSAKFTRKVLDFWGISHKSCLVNPTSQYVRTQFRIDADYNYRLGKCFYFGAVASLNHTCASELQNPSYLEGQQTGYYLTGIGASFQIDTRDNPTNPQKGMYLMLRETAYPEFLGTSDMTNWATTFILSGYQPIWKGGLITGDLYAQLNNHDAPWILREELGGAMGRMRGYYAGRFIDANQVCAQIELRQHIASRFGCVAWLGAGTVFPSLNGFAWKNILPNYGVGLRVEFKHNMNLRVDFGFGKETAGLCFGFGEAF
jgi:outer membrane protein assembly factor BamA